MNHVYSGIVRFFCRNLLFFTALALIVFGLVLSPIFPETKWLAIVPFAVFSIKILIQGTVGLFLIVFGMFAGLLGVLLSLLAAVIEKFERPAPNSPKL